MPMPVRSLPVLQNWDCGGCSDCCRTYHVSVNEDERARIEAQGWEGEPPIVWDEKAKGYRLNHTADGRCVLLGPDNRCQIHAKFGAAAKPMACRIYPFVMVPAGDHWRVGLRFGCPAVAANSGRPMAEQGADAREYAGLLEADANRSVRDLPPPPLQPGQMIPWMDLVRFIQAIDQRLADTAVPIERRLRQVIALAKVCRVSRFDKLSGARLAEFLEVVSAAAADDVPVVPTAVPPPGWVGRTLFRQLIAVYARKDNGPDAGVGRNGRLTRFLAVWRFARGTGRVPKLHAQIPDTTFAAAEQPRGPLPADADALLTRYFRVKVGSAQFFGPSNFRLPFWTGLDSLLLTFPTILWLSRVLMGERAGALDAAVVQRAVRIVDDNFGFNVLLGTGRQAWATRALADRDEIAKLVAWYAR